MSRKKTKRRMERRRIMSIKILFKKDSLLKVFKYVETGVYYADYDFSEDPLHRVRRFKKHEPTQTTSLERIP